VNRWKVSLPIELTCADNVTAQLKQFGELAQLGERLVCNQEVTGSSPVFSTSLRSRLRRELRLGRPAGRRRLSRRSREAAEADRD
jgi:hypothetical protein